MLNIRPVVSAPLAACCTILSVFGVIILFAFGALFARHAETLVGSEENPADPGAVAKLCYLAGFVYVGFLVFCGMQMVVHNRYPRGVQL